jgi:hypothetical protein
VDQYYSNGFHLPLEAVGSTFTRVGPVVPFNKGVVALTAGDLFSEDLAVWLFVQITQPRPNVLVAEKTTEMVKLSVGTGTGRVFGVFTDFMTGLRTPIRGIVLQEQNSVAGYFLSTDSSGYFWISPSQ